jgi:non-ribosomal peptide synthetase-like protein
MSMKDIYAHPTIRSLAEAFGIADAEAEVQVDLDAIPTLIQPRDPILARSAAPASTRQYLMCGALQLLFFLVYAWVFALVGARAYEWISAAHGYEAIYLRSVVFGGAGFIVLCAVPILAKWVLIGRWKPQQIRVWSLQYFRFWIVKTLVRSNPLILVTVGSPLYTWYLRALGAKIGRGTVIFTRRVPVCTDLLTIGPDTVIRKESFLSCYRAYAGWIQTGRVTIGRNVFVGEKTVLDINTSMGDVSQLGHTSSLHSGQRVRTGERWHGSPAQRTSVNYLRVSSKPCGRWRRFRFSAITLLCVFFLYLPLLEGGTFALLTAVPMLGNVLNPSTGAITTSSLYLDALVLSLVLFFGSVLLGLVFVATVPRLLRVFVKPCAVYPLFGFRDRIHRAIARMTGGKFFTRLFGDSSYITSYLRWLGYDLGQVVQTGSNFGTDVGQENPYMNIIGSGTMVADGLHIMNADVSATSFRVSPVYIGGDSFFGNNIYYPAGGRVGNNCLIATKAMIPLDGKVREGVGLLGSPPFEIPRTVERDQAVELDEPERRRRLRAKNWHNLRTIGIFLFARWLHVFLITAFALAAFDSYGGFAQLELGESLPWYMVPAAFHWREGLPLTANSKIDSKSLTALAGELGDAAAGADYDAPGTPTERRLAQAWAKVLGIPQDQISRHDNFFDRGGSSLLAVKLAIALDRAVSLKELTRHPVLADMAGLIDGKSERRSGLLQPLLEPPGPDAALVCFPYAGGNAVNFQSMAGALRGQRAGRLRGRAARSRPGRRGRAVRLDG